MYWFGTGIELVLLELWLSVFTKEELLLLLLLLLALLALLAVVAWFEVELLLEFWACFVFELRLLFVLGWVGWLMAIELLLIIKLLLLLESLFKFVKLFAFINELFFVFAEFVIAFWRWIGGEKQQNILLKRLLPLLRFTANYNKEKISFNAWIENNLKTSNCVIYGYGDYVASANIVRKRVRTF